MTESMSVFTTDSAPISHCLEVSFLLKRKHFSISFLFWKEIIGDFFPF